MKYWEDYIEQHTGLPSSSKKVENSCNCKPKCKVVYEFTSVNKFICEKRAEKLMYRMISLVKNVDPDVRGRGKPGWTMSETKYLKDWLENNEVRMGDYVRIGKILGKTRTSIKGKVQYMEKNGQVDRLDRRLGNIGTRKKV